MVVVIFTCSNEFSVIPINWLSQNILEVSNILDIEYCEWLPFRVTSTELLKVDDPDETWNIYKIRILDNKIYSN